MFKYNLTKNQFSLCRSLGMIAEWLVGLSSEGWIANRQEEFLYLGFIGLFQISS